MTEDFELEEDGYRFARCPACGSRATHQQSGSVWHCHGCGLHWERDPYYSGGPVDPDIRNEPCGWDEVDLCY